ncbi:MAG TPA: MFS transporter [Kineosporiaceae bacterium]|nr:MFS transporter [Kineosporiaceae bacterium]
MSLLAYRRVLALPGVLRLLAFAVLARVPHSGAGVVITLYVVIGTGRGYAAAGLVAAMSTIGTAIGAPWRGRAVDRVGLRRALLPSVLAVATVWAAIPFLGFGALLFVAFVGGLLSVPIFTVVRQSLAALVPLPQQHTAFALDSIGTEITFMIGPALAVLLATQWSTTGTVFAVGATLALAGLGLMIFNPPTRSAAQPNQRSESSALEGGKPALLRDPALLAVLAITAGTLVVLSGTDVSIVAQVRATGDLGLTWVVFVAWSLSSLVGGLVFGAARRAVPPALLLLGLGLLTIPVGLASSAWWLAVAVLPAGFLCAPTLSATATVISRLVPEERRGEAMGWYGSAMTLGIAAGTPAAGAAIDVVGPWAGFALLGGVGVGVALIGLLLIPWGTDRPGSVDPGAPSGVSPTCRLAVSTGSHVDSIDEG